MKITKAFGKHEMLIMTKDEFREWMKDKKCYHPVVHWMEEWRGSGGLEDYIPMKAVILPATVKLIEHEHYKNAKVLDSWIEGTENTTRGGMKGYWEIDHWTAGINERTKRIHVRVVKGT
jgi:hypothetical protein